MPLLKKFRIFLWLGLLGMFNACQSINSPDNVWTSASAFGHLHPDSHYFFQIETHLRFNTTGKIFRQNLNVIRLGKELNSRVSYVIGYGFIPTRVPIGLVNEQRVWQQIDLVPPFVPNIKLQIYNRMEQRWVQEFTGIAFRNRFKVVLTYCRDGWLTCPLLSSETFFNFNQPVWDNSHFISQQRSFIALQRRLTPQTLIRIGYLNQYIWPKSGSASFNIIDFQLAHNFD